MKQKHYHHHEPFYLRMLGLLYKWVHHLSFNFSTFSRTPSLIKSPFLLHLMTDAGLPPLEMHWSSATFPCLRISWGPAVRTGGWGGEMTRTRAYRDLIGSELSVAPTWHWYLASSSTVALMMIRCQSLPSSPVIWYLLYSDKSREVPRPKSSAQEDKKYNIVSNI